MDADTLHSLASLLRTQRVASLGTLRSGAPLVSLVLYALEPDFSAFYLHLSRLAQHAQALQADPRLGLMIAEPDEGGRDPQLLKRVSIQSEAVCVDKRTNAYDRARDLYLSRFPASQPMFALGDFDLYRIEPQAARFVAGFGQAYNLAAGHFREAGLLE